MSRLIRIDSHQHFWRYCPTEYPWISHDMGILKRDFLPADFESLLSQCSISGSIVVQARQSKFETDWLIQLSKNYPFIYGVVGWLDLCSTSLEDELTKYEKEKVLKGFRHVLQDRESEYLMRHPPFISGLLTLARHEYSYDFLIVSRQISEAMRLIEKLPQMRLVIDHIAKPQISSFEWEPWASSVRHLASVPHVYCKLSGLVTEASWGNWRKETIQKYIEHILSCFSADRIMFGSDWPVCTLAASYEAVTQLVEDYLLHYAPEAYPKIMGENAANFYRITS